MAGDRAPLFSLVTPVYNPPVDVLKQTLDSVVAQTFTDWELVLVDDCSPNPEVRATLRRYAARDDRLVIIERKTNGHIVAASNDGVEAARGAFIALLDHDDLLTPNALSVNARVINEAEQAGEPVDYLYSDEDKTSDLRRSYDVFRKPDWSPERLRSQNYCCHFSVARADLVRAVGGFRSGYDGSQDHDLILRVTERARRIVHIPEVLYHWRAIEGSTAADTGNKSYAEEAGRRAVQDHLDRTDVDGTVEVVRGAPYRVHRTLPPQRRVSIVIPTIGSEAPIWGRRSPMVIEAVRSAIEHTTHANLEVVVVVDDPTPPTVVQELQEIAEERLVVVRFHERFNYSRKMNFGVLASTGDRLVLLNDDTSVRTPEWLDDLLGPLEEPGVVMTGAMLRYSSGAVQHAGLALLRGHYWHAYRGSMSQAGMFGDLAVGREVSGVTGACMGMRRDTFLDVGGFCEDLDVNFNDVDLCYKVRASGGRILFVPAVELYHFESKTRVAKVHPDESAYMRRRWGRTTARDPYLPVFPDMPLTAREHVEERRRTRRRERMMT